MFLISTVKEVFILFSIFFLYNFVQGKDDLIWKTYDGEVPKGCDPIPGQTNLYFGLAHFIIPNINVSGLIPTTVANKFDYLNITLDGNVYFVSYQNVDLKVLCGMENSEESLDYIPTTSENFPSLFGTNTEPIPVGWEFYHKGTAQEKWFNATLYAGIVNFVSREGRQRVVVGKVYTNANKELDNKIFYGDLNDELSNTKYDVFVLRKN